MDRSFFIELKDTLTHIAESGELIRSWDESRNPKSKTSWINYYEFQTSDEGKYTLELDQRSFPSRGSFLMWTDIEKEKDNIETQLQGKEPYTLCSLSFYREVDGVVFEGIGNFSKTIVFEVFATIRQILKEYFALHGFPLGILFQGNPSEPSRLRLYRELAKGLTNQGYTFFEYSTDNIFGKKDTFLLIKGIEDK